MARASENPRVKEPAYTNAAGSCPRAMVISLPIGDVKMKCIVSDCQITGTGGCHALCDFSPYIISTLNLNIYIEKETSQNVTLIKCPLRWPSWL